MRRYKIPSGCKLPHRPCCADCKDRACEVRCLNSPERCGCYWEEPEPSPKRARRSKIDRKELLRLHKLGLLQRDIAARMGCSVAMVSATLREMGVRRYG